MPLMAIYNFVYARYISHRELSLSNSIIGLITQYNQLLLSFHLQRNFNPDYYLSIKITHQTHKSNPALLLAIKLNIRSKYYQNLFTLNKNNTYF